VSRPHQIRVSCADLFGTGSAPNILLITDLNELVARLARPREACMARVRRSRHLLVAAAPGRREQGPRRRSSWRNDTAGARNRSLGSPTPSSVSWCSTRDGSMKQSRDWSAPSAPCAPRRSLAPGWACAMLPPSWSWPEAARRSR